MFFASVSFVYANGSAANLIEVNSSVTDNVVNTQSFYNRKYDEYVQSISDLSEEEKEIKMVEAPSMYSYNETYSTSARASLPDKYNFSLSPSYVSTFVDRGTYPTGWAFASNAALEAYMMKNGLKAGADYSEEHLRYCLQNAYGGDSELYGYMMSNDNVGCFNMAVSYWNRGKYCGPIDDKDMVYISASGSGAYTLSELASKSKDDILVSDTVTLSSLSADATNSDISARITSIKNMVYDFGGVYTSMSFNDDAFNSSNTAYYNDGSLSTDSSSQFTIIGWDDDYSKGNFGQYQPTTNGAFAVADSRTLGSRESRIYYISYGMVSSFGTCSAVSAVKDNTYYKRYETDTRIAPENESGSYVVSGGTTNVFAKKFAVDLNSNIQYVSEIATYCPAPSSYYKIYISATGDMADLEPVEISNYNNLSNGSYVENMGYHSFELETPVEILGDSFCVAIQVYNANGLGTIPMGSVIDYTSASNEVQLASSIDNIKNNSDITTSQKVILKAYTTGNMPEAKVWTIADKNMGSSRTIDSTTIINGLTIAANSEKTVNITSSKTDVNNLVYKKMLQLSGKGNRNYRNVSFNLPSNDTSYDLYITAKSSTEGYDRVLCIDNTNGGITTLAVDQPDTYIIEDVKPGTIYLYSQNSGISLYNVGYKPHTGNMAASDDDNKEWTFSSDELDSTENILTSDVSTSDGLIIRASESNPMRIIRSTNHANGFKYYQCVSIDGTSEYNDGLIEFDVKGNMDIYVTAAFSNSDAGDETRILLVKNQFGKDIISKVDDSSASSVTVTNEIKTYKLNYNGNGDKVMLMSNDSNIRIYKISLVYRDNETGNADAKINVGDYFEEACVITENQSLGDYFTLISDSDNTVAIIDSGNVTYNGNSYPRAIRTSEPCTSHRDGRSLRFHVYDSTDTPTYILCLSTGIGSIVLADDYELLNETTGNGLKLSAFEYRGYARDLYLYTTGSLGILGVELNNDLTSTLSLDDDLSVQLDSDSEIVESVSDEIESADVIIEDEGIDDLENSSQLDPEITFELSDLSIEEATDDSIEKNEDENQNELSDNTENIENIGDIEVNE